MPAYFIYSLLKKYLRVTSHNSASPLHGNEATPLESFAQFHDLFELVMELFTVLDWIFRRPEHSNKDAVHFQTLLSGSSIFTGTMSPHGRLGFGKILKKQYKCRKDFESDREYGDYVKSVIEVGMKVRARVSFETIVEGDIGEFKRSNSGTPPAQFSWAGLSGNTYWVYWHQVELLVDTPLLAGWMNSDRSGKQ